MSELNLDRVKQIFLEVRDEPGGRTRAGCSIALCGGDEALRGRRSELSSRPRPRNRRVPRLRRPWPRPNAAATGGGGFCQ